MGERQKVRAVWERQVERYGEKRTADPSFVVQQRRVLALLPDECRRILEIGCGGGWLLASLAVVSERWVCGDDLSPEMLLATQDRLRARSAAPRLQLPAADCQALPFGKEALDCIIGMGVLEYVPDLLLVGSELRRVLRPGGHLILTVPNAGAPYKVWRSALVALYRSISRLAGQA